MATARAPGLAAKKWRSVGLALSLSDSKVGMIRSAREGPCSLESGEGETVLPASLPLAPGWKAMGILGSALGGGAEGVQGISQSS